MKVLFIGNFHELNGWGIQQINHLLALDSAGVEVVPRRLNITGNTNPDIHPRILELEKKTSRNCDLVVLNTLPSFYERRGNARFLSFSMAETSNFKMAGWAQRLNIMDMCLCPNYFNKQVFINSGVTKPIGIVPLAIPTWEGNYPTHQIRQQFPDTTIFYTIGELTRRKNVEAIISAFYAEFSEADPVVLFIKTTPTGLGDNPQRTVEDFIQKIKTGTKLSNFPRCIVSVSFSSEEEINSLHQSGDVYVTASRGEAFNLPLGVAMLAGKVVISPDHSGMDYITDKNAYVVRSTEQACFGAVDTLSDLYTSFETWFDCSVLSIREQIRNAFTKHDLNRKKIEQARKDIQKFSIENVGIAYKKVLEGITK